jgi:hypothetical protein
MIQSSTNKEKKRDLQVIPAPRASIHRVEVGIAKMRMAAKTSHADKASLTLRGGVGAGPAER